MLLSLVFIAPLKTPEGLFHYRNLLRVDGYWLSLAKDSTGHAHLVKFSEDGRLLSKISLSFCCARWLDYSDTLFVVTP